MYLGHDFKDKVVVITGAAGVLCSEMAFAFAKAGAKVCALDLNKDKLDEIETQAKEQNLIIKGYKTSVLDKDELEKTYDLIKCDFGNCDILVNGAGGNSPKATTSNEFANEATSDGVSFFDLDPKGVDFVFGLNFQGTLLPCQVFCKTMQENNKGVVLNISSMNAFTPLTKIPAYSAAKAAISNFTQWLAVHFAKSNIRCNAIAPGFLVSNQNKALLYNEDGTPTKRANKILTNTPMSRFVESHELIGGLFYLCDDLTSSAVTGVVLPIDAGFSSYSGV